MADLPVDYIVAGVALELFSWNKYERMPLDDREFKAVFEKTFGIDLNDDNLSKLISRLSELQFIGIDDDPYIGRTISTSENVIRYRFERNARQANIFGRARKNGRDWLIRVFKTEQFWKDVATSPISEPVEGVIAEEIPAADRTVTVLHNSEEGKLLNAGLEKIEDDLLTNNEVASEAGEDRERLLSEVKASRNLLWSERLRVDVLKTVVLNFLKEISTKFRAKSVDWGVSQMIDVIENLIKEMF